MRRRRFFVPLFVLMLVSSTLPVLPISEAVIPSAKACWPPGNTCTTVAYDNDRMPKVPVSAGGSNDTGGILKVGESTGEDTGHSRTGRNPAEDVDPPPYCMDGAWPFNAPRRDPEDGAPIIRPNSIAQPAWHQRVVRMMRDRAVLSMEAGQVNARGPQWGMGIVDILREFLQMRLEDDDGRSATAPVALSVNGSGMGFPSDSGAWWGGGNLAATEATYTPPANPNSFYHDFALASTKGPYDPDPWTQLSLYAAPVDTSDPHGMSNGVQYYWFENHKSTMEGVQRVWMRFGDFYSNAAYGNGAPAESDGSIWFNRAKAYDESAPPIKTIGKYVWHKEERTCFTVPAQTDATTGTTTPAYQDCDPWAEVSGTDQTYIITQERRQMIYTGDLVKDGMGSRNGLTPYNLAAPFSGQDLTLAYPKDAPHLPVGPTIAAKALNTAMWFFGVNDAVSNNGHRFDIIPIDLYYRQPVYGRTSTGVVSGDPFFTTTGSYTVTQPLLTRKIEEQPVEVVSGTIPSGVDKPSPSDDTSMTTGLHTRYVWETTPPTNIAYSGGLEAAARLYFNVRKVSRETDYANLDEYVGVERSLPYAPVVTTKPTVFKDMSAIVTMMNNHWYKDPSAVFYWSKGGTRAPGLKADDPSLGAGKDDFYHWVFYPVTMSPWDEGNTPVADIGTARLTACNDERASIVKGLVISGGSMGRGGGGMPVTTDNVLFEPGGRPSEEYGRAMTAHVNGCNMALVNSISAAPAVPQLQHCWYRWRPQKITMPKFPKEAAKVVLESRLQWFKGDHSRAQPWTKSIYYSSLGDPRFIRVDVAATVGQPYELRMATTATGTVRGYGDYPGYQPVAYLNYRGQSATLGEQLYVNGTQVGTTYELGQPNNGGQILWVTPSGGGSKIQLVPRNMGAPYSGASANVKITFEETPSSYMQSHPECMKKTPQELLTMCGIGYDIGTKSYFYQVRVRTWWEIVWGNDPEIRDFDITAYGLNWFSRRLGAGGSDYWTQDDTWAKWFIRPWTDNAWIKDGIYLPYTKVPDRLMEFPQQSPKFKPGEDWACLDAPGISCAGGAWTTPELVIHDRGGADRTDGVPAKKPGWQRFDLGDAGTNTAICGYAGQSNCWRPMIDTSLYCSDFSNAFAGTAPTTQAGWEDSIMADCIFNIPVLQAQRN